MGISSVGVFKGPLPQSPGNHTEAEQRTEGFRGASVCLHCDEDAGSARCPQPSRSSRSPSLLRLHSLCPSDLGSSCSDEVSFCCLYMTYTRSPGGRHQVAHGYVTLDRKTHAGSCETHQRLSLCSVPARVPRCSVCRTGTALCLSRWSRQLRLSGHDGSSCPLKGAQGSRGPGRFHQVDVRWPLRSRLPSARPHSCGLLSVSTRVGCGAWTPSPASCVLQGLGTDHG